MTYTHDDINNWPSDSYAGQERDLADLLDTSTLEAIDRALETDEFACYTIFILLMMNTEAFVAMTDNNDADMKENARLTLRQKVQDDARDDSGEYFQMRIAQRIEMKKRLERLTGEFDRKLKEKWIGEWSEE